ncbi:MAG: hypothetical protein ACOY3P_13455 [Planctomycetota bacterium]
MKRRLLVVASLLASLAGGTFAKDAAGAVELKLDALSTGTAPGGTAPWLTATFTTTTTVGGFERVLLTLDAGGLINSEFVSDWAFNFDPALNLSDLTVDFTTATKTGAFDNPSFVKDLNDVDVNGPSGLFDFDYGFETSNSGGGTKRFGADEVFANIVLKYPVASAGTLTENSFNFPSAAKNPGDPGGMFSSAHVQGIGVNATQSAGIVDNTNNNVPPTPPGGGGGTEGVPEPASMVIWCLGAIGATWYGVRRQRRKATG